MKSMPLMYANEADGPSTPEEQQAVQAAWMALLREAKAAGVLALCGNGAERAYLRRRLDELVQPSG